MNNRFTVAASTLLFAFSHCFGQAGSPDQVAFNRAVLDYQTAVLEETAKLSKATQSQDTQPDDNPIRKNKQAKLVGDIARQNATRVANAAAAVQIRGSRMGSDEWLGVVSRIADMSDEGANPPKVKLPGKYCVEILWSPDGSQGLTLAIQTAESLCKNKGTMSRLPANQNTVIALLWIDETDNRLLEEAAALNPKDCVLFTVDPVNTRDIRLARLQEMNDDSEAEKVLFKFAHLSPRSILSTLPPSIVFGSDRNQVSLHTISQPGKSAQPATKAPDITGIHLKSVHVISKDAAEKLAKTAAEFGAALDQHIYVEPAKMSIPPERRSELSQWDKSVTDSLERLTHEAEARTFEDHGNPSRSALTAEVAKKAADTAPDSLKPRALTTLALAQLRNGKPSESLGTLQRLQNLKPAPKTAQLASIVQCLAHLAKGDREAGIKEAGDAVNTLNADAAKLPDYRQLALISEVQAQTGIEMSGGDKGIEIKLDGKQSGISGKAKFFDIEAEGSRFAYIVDISGSMDGARIVQLREELVRSASGLPDGSDFMIAAFSSDTSPLGNRREWTAASASSKRWARGEIMRLQPAGGTNPGGAFKMVFDLRPRPDAIFLLTDGEIPDNEVEMIVLLNKEYKIPTYCVCLESKEGENALKRIAKESGGKYLFVAGTNQSGRP